MLEYERTDVSEGTDLNKTSNSKECDICHYWYFSDKNFKYEPYLYNGYHDLMQKAMNFNGVAIVSIKGNDYRIHFWYMSKTDAINLLSNSVLDNKGVLSIIMDFDANKTPVEVIKEGAFRGTYFGDIYSGINGKWYRKSWKEFDELRNIDQNYYCSNYYDASVNKYGVKCGTSLRIWENKGCIHSIDPYGWFQGYYRYRLSRRSVDDKRHINRWKKL